MERLTLSGPAFSVVRLARHGGLEAQGGGGGPQRPRCQKSRFHQPMKMKLRMSHYGHKSMPDAKLESDSFSIFGDLK